MRTREEAALEAPQALLRGTPPGLRVLINGSAFLLNWEPRQVWRRSTARQGEPSRAPGRCLRQDAPHFSSCLLSQELLLLTHCS